MRTHLYQDWLRVLYRDDSGRVRLAHNDLNLSDIPIDGRAVDRLEEIISIIQRYTLDEDDRGWQEATLYDWFSSAAPRPDIPCYFWNGTPLDTYRKLVEFAKNQRDEYERGKLLAEAEWERNRPVREAQRKAEDEARELEARHRRRQYWTWGLGFLAWIALGGLLIGWIGVDFESPAGERLFGVYTLASMVIALLVAKLDQKK